MVHFISSNTHFTAFNYIPWEKDGLQRLKDLVLILCHKGSASIDLELETHALTPHTQVLILPESIVELHDVSEDFSASYTTLSAPLFREVTIRFDPSFSGFLRNNPCITLEAEHTKSAHYLIDILLTLRQDSENIYQQEIAKNLFQAFFLDVYDKIQRCCIGAIHPEGVNRASELFKEFIRLVHKHCQTEREVSFYAKELCITPRYLSTIVSQVTDGKTTKAIIDRHAILEIKLLLKTTSLSIQEIAHRLAFPDQSFLGRYFKRHTGFSPHLFRKEKQQS